MTTMRTKVRRGEYGVVRFRAGALKGRLAYYDDDEGRNIVVYREGALPFGAPELAFLKDVEHVEEDIESEFMSSYGKVVLLQAPLQRQVER